MKTRIHLLIVALSMLLMSACAGMVGRPAPLAPQEQELLMSVLKNDLGSATRLLQAGASPNASAASGNSILQTAVYSGHIEMVKLLLRHKGDVNFVNTDGCFARVRR